MWRWNNFFRCMERGDGDKKSQPFFFLQFWLQLCTVYFPVSVGKKPCVIFNIIIPQNISRIIANLKLRYIAYKAIIYWQKLFSLFNLFDKARACQVKTSISRQIKQSTTYQWIQPLLKLPVNPQIKIILYLAFRPIVIRYCTCNFSCASSTCDCWLHELFFGLFVLLVCFIFSNGQCRKKHSCYVIHT